MKTVPLINLFLRQTRLFSFCTYYIISVKTNQEICRIISDFKISVTSSHTRTAFLFETHFTWHTAQRKNKSNQLLYSFSEITAAIFLFRRNTNFSTAPFSKRRTKTVWSFFLRNYLCRVPGKISLIIVFPQVTLYLAALYNPLHTRTENKPFRHDAAKTQNRLNHTATASETPLSPFPFSEPYCVTQDLSPVTCLI